MTPQTTDFLLHLFQQLIMDNRKLYCTATINHFDIAIWLYGRQIKDKHVQSRLTCTALVQLTFHSRHASTPMALEPFLYKDVSYLTTKIANEQ